METTKKYLLGLVLGTAMVLSLASSVSAEQTLVPRLVLPGTNDADKETVVQIGPRGNTLLRGTVSAVGSNTVTVKSWGGDWVVNISSSTQLMPLSAMSQFQVGDFVGVQGMTNTSASWTVDATLVRDWTARKMASDTKKEVQDLIKSVTPRNWQGSVMSVDTVANTFVLSIDGTSYTISLASDAQVVNEGYGKITLASLKVGDTVRIYASLSGTTATALVVRDTAIKPHYDVKANVK
jgi:hypothetical protein